MLSPLAAPAPSSPPSGFALPDGLPPRNGSAVPTPGTSAARPATAQDQEPSAARPAGPASVATAPSVAVAHLLLTDFRCYGRLSLDLPPRPVVLTGPNGAGKTNLLEALSFLTPGRGLRRVSLSEAGHRAAPTAPPRPWAVAAHLHTPDGPLDIGTGREGAGEAAPSESGTTTERRLVRIDGQTVRNQTALAERLGVLWLTPEMDRLLQEGAASRRRFLDRLVFGIDPAHAGRVSAYEQAMRERARILRDCPGETRWLEALEGQMAERGIAIAAARADLVAHLTRAMTAQTGPFPQARLALEGGVEAWLTTMPALAAEDRLRDALASRRRQDTESGTTSLGPHRSDLLLHHGPKDQPAAQCSTGEQKALLIALVLANARLQARLKGRPPLMLLDEVAAHLDRDRRAALCAALAELGGQSWLTGTDPDLFQAWRDQAHFLTVQDGDIKPDPGGA